MNDKRYCNYCLGASRASVDSPSHPALPHSAPAPAHVKAFLHSGRTCPHLKLHREIWRLSSQKFYKEYITTFEEAGLGPGALIHIASNLPSDIYKPWEKIAVVTGIDFENDALYGLENGFNNILSLSLSDPDSQFMFPRGLSLYPYDVLVNNPSIDHSKELQPQVSDLARLKIPSLIYNRQGTKGSFSLDCWNEPPTWHVAYQITRRSSFTIKVIERSEFKAPDPLDEINYEHVVSTIRKEGSYRSKNIRYYWSAHLDD